MNRLKLRKRKEPNDDTKRSLVLVLGLLCRESSDVPNGLYEGTYQDPCSESSATLTLPASFELISIVSESDIFENEFTLGAVR